MDLRSRYQALSKEALIDELIALHESGNQSVHDSERNSEPRQTNQDSSNTPPKVGFSLSNQERSMVKHLSDSIILADSNSRITDWNAGAEKMFGYPAQEVVGQIVGEVLHPSQSAAYFETIHADLETKGLWLGQIPAVTKDGIELVCDSVVLRHLDDNGNNLGTIGINRNTGWQSRAEAAEAHNQQTQTRLDGSEAELAESQQRYKELIECIPDVVWTIDADGIITYMSPATERITGFKPSELVGTHLFDSQDIVPESARVGSIIDRFKGLLDPAAREDGFVFRHVYKRADGSFLDAELRVSAQLDPDGNLVGLSGITRDVGEIVRAQQARLSLEARLMQSQKMEAIGQLAGGIAHDINNVLTAIMGNTELMLQSTEETDARYFGLTEIDRASQRAARMMKSLLAFSRQQELHSQFVDLREILTQMEDFLKGLLGVDAKIRTDAGAVPLWVIADPGQIEQVMMNLIINAGDATAEGGEITVGMEAHTLRDQSKVALPAGQYAKLWVTDTGAGIESTTLPRVFEPFYTTKKPNLGTGLGLSSAYGIIQQSGGTIDVVSEIGVGTTFSVYLPLVSRDATVDTAEAPPKSIKIVRQKSTILIAEDNPEVGVMLQQALENAGYSVLLSSTGEQAVEIAHRAIGRIDLLITDYDMPGMNGLDLSREITALHDETEILHISGHIDISFSDLGEGETAPHFLAKPFGPRTLLEKVGLILEIPEI